MAATLDPRIAAQTFIQHHTAYAAATLAEARRVVTKVLPETTVQLAAQLRHQWVLLILIIVGAYTSQLCFRDTSEALAAMDSVWNTIRGLFIDVADAPNALFGPVRNAASSTCHVMSGAGQVCTFSLFGHRVCTSVPGVGALGAEFCTIASDIPHLNATNDFPAGPNPDMCLPLNSPIVMLRIVLHHTVGGLAQDVLAADTIPITILVVCVVVLLAQEAARVGEQLAPNPAPLWALLKPAVALVDSYVLRSRQPSKTAAPMMMTMMARRRGAAALMAMVFLVATLAPFVPWVIGAARSLLATMLSPITDISDVAVVNVCAFFCVGQFLVGVALVLFIAFIAVQCGPLVGAALHLADRVKHQLMSLTLTPLVYVFVVYAPSLVMKDE